MTTLALVCFLLALGPALLFRANLRLYRPPPAVTTGRPGVSVLIPARNEERSILAAVGSVLAGDGVDLELLVLDDHSEDDTAALVRAVSAGDGRVRLLEGEPLPAGWCGKQHACWQLARAARHEFLVFLDADVRLAPDALRRLAAFLAESDADLASGVPWQETVTWLERLLLPLIHFLLLGFLPLGRMRNSAAPAYGAGCGQLFIARRRAYEACGGHATICASLHDGLTLPRAFRAAGFRTDLCDVTDLASCRMYRRAAEVWHGLARNAREGLAGAHLIVPVTALLVLGQVVPVILLAALPWLDLPAQLLTAAAVLAAYYPRLAAWRRFRQDLAGACLHPLGVLVLLAIQWYAFTRSLLGRPSSWKGRAYRVGTQVAERHPAASARRTASF